MRTEASYLWDQILRHVGLFYSAEAYQVLRESGAGFTSFAEALAVREPRIVIPIDLPAAGQPLDWFDVSFNGTTMRLWPRLPAPDAPEWTAVPDAAHPLWYRHSSGTLIPGWDLFGTLFGLLSFREEMDGPQRDQHGRFVGKYSPRERAGLLEEPVFNNAVALLVGAALGLTSGGMPTDQIGPHLLPARVVLSHDCDQLRGNDLWTQLIRLYRVAEPLKRLRPPRLQNLWWTLRNAVRPRDFYLDNIRGMILLERMFNCRSTFYLINGTGGRFGARSGSGLIPEAVSIIPAEWEAGIHYNYDTHLSRERLAAQFAELEVLVGRKIICGRAHYLRFDASRSFSLYRDCGLEVDETAGYSDRIGFRCGIAGCFQPWNPTDRVAHDIVELPMAVMDGTLMSQYQDGAVRRFEELLSHLTRVGGALTVVVHPGQFFNPERPETHYFYHRLLQKVRELGATAETAISLAAKFRNRPAR